MEEIKVKYENTRIEYKAVDGTVFRDKTSCEEYENTVKCVLLERLKDCQLSCGEEESTFSMGSCDVISHVVVPRTTKDVETINQLWLLQHNPKDFDLPVNNSHIGRPIIVSVITYDSSIWVMRYDDIVSRATNGKFVLCEQKEQMEYSKHNI